MPTVGVKVTQIPKFATVGLFAKYLQTFSPSLPPINSSHLKDGDSSFKFAFVNFSSIEDAKVAVKAINKRPLEGHSLFAKIRNEAQCLSEITSPLQPEPTGKSIKISNISESISEQQLHQTFNQFGSIVSVRLCLQGSPCYAYVNYDSVDSAHSAVAKMNNTTLCGNIVQVTIQQSRKRPSNEGTNIKAVETNLFQPLKEGLYISIKEDKALTPAVSSLKRHSFSLDHLSSSSVDIETDKYGSLMQTTKQPKKHRLSDDSDGLPEYIDEDIVPDTKQNALPNTCFVPASSQVNTSTRDKPPSTDNTIPSSSGFSFSVPTLVQVSGNIPSENVQKVLTSSFSKQTLHQSSNKISMQVQEPSTLSTTDKTTSSKGGHKDFFFSVPKSIPVPGKTSMKSVQKVTTFSFTKPVHHRSTNIPLVKVKKPLPLSTGSRRTPIIKHEQSSNIQPAPIHSLPSSLEIPVKSSVSHIIPKSPIPYLSKEPMRQAIAKSLQLKSPSMINLLSKKCPTLLKDLGTNVKVAYSEDKTKINLTGERHQVDVAIIRLNKQLKTFQDQMKTKLIGIEAFHAPMFLEDIFIAEISNLSNKRCVEIHAVKDTRISKENLSIHDLAQLIKANQKNKLLLLHDLYKLQLLTHSTSQQWFIQTACGDWRPVPEETNQRFNRHPFRPHHITEGGTIYNVDLHNKIAVNASTGFTHSLKSEDKQAVWYRFQDDHFGFVPYDDNESKLIEQCYNEHITKPVICDDIRQCYFSFESLVEIDLTNKSLTSIKREPPTSTAFLSPTIHFSITGLVPDVGQAVKDFDELLQKSVQTKPLPDGVIISCPQLFESFAQQYCIEITSAKSGHITARGVENYTNAVLLQLVSYMMKYSFQPTSDIQLSVPEEWTYQDSDIELKVVEENSLEWNNVHIQWKKTMSQPVKKIQRIQNKWQWRHYSLCRDRIKEKNGGQENEMWLFHGTRDTNPSDIYKSEKGFDFRFSRPGMWGYGSYFAANASYSAAYAYQTSTGDKNIFLARVLIGEYIDVPPRPSLKMPPLKTTTGTGRYDSIKGDTKGSDVYIVYEHDKAYPAYLITY